jgi:hypothetical protein
MKGDSAMAASETRCSPRVLNGALTASWVTWMTVLDGLEISAVRGHPPVT